MVVAVTVLVLAVVGSLAIGSHRVPAGDVWRALVDYDPTDPDHVIVRHARIPRTVLGLMVGLALGLAGLLMQSITRNPLAEPGLFAVNAGAAAAVVIAIAGLGIVEPSAYIWFSFVGAAIAGTVVYLLGSAHGSAATPARMALAGAAIAFAVAAVTDMILLSYESVFYQFRFWSVGSLQGRDLGVASAVLPFMIAGVLGAFALIRRLDAMALGDELASGLGARPTRTRLASAVVIILLSGASTAAVGPIAFVGLAAPHIVRLAVGGAHRLLVPGVAVVGPAFLLSADVMGRWVIAPAEIPSGVAAAIFGGPVFVALVRGRRLAAL